MSNIDDKALKVFDGAVQKNVSLSEFSRMFAEGLDNMDGAAPERPTRPYSQSTWAYICINKIIETARSIQLMISDANENIIEAGDAYNFLLGNNKMPFTKFITETAGYLALYKECYWITLDTDIAVPTSLLIVGPNQLRPVIRSGQIVGYQLRQPGKSPIPLFLEDVYPLIDFNPDSPFEGVGPDKVGKIAMSTSYQAGLLNESTLANGGKIGNLIIVPGRLDPTEKNFLVSQFEAKHKGARNAGKTCIMTGGADVKNMAQSMVELQMLDLIQYSASEICSLFGVPPEVVGLNSEAQYAHGPAQQRFIVNTISALLSFIAEHITTGILSRFKNRTSIGQQLSRSKCYHGTACRVKRLPSYRQAAIKAVQSNYKLFAWFAIEEHPTMQEMLQERSEKVLKYTQSGIMLNNIIDAFDLPFEKTPWGNTWLVPMGLVPAEYAMNPENATGPGDLPEGQTDDDEDPQDDPEKDPGTKGLDNDYTEKAGEQARLRIWRKWTASWAGLEKEYTQSLRTLFVRQQRILTKKLKDAFERYGQKAINTKDAAADIIANVVFDLKLEDEKIKVINTVYFEKASRLGAAQVVSETTGLSGKELIDTAERITNSPTVRGAITASSKEITRVNRTTQKRIAKAISRGLKKGDGLSKLTTRIKDVLGFDASRKRALGIARTSTGGAVSAGRHEAMKQYAKEKSWITSKDKEVRASHKAAEAATKAGIPVNQPFAVGNDMLMYPGDPSGSAAEIANCRCLVIAVRAGGKSLGLDYYDRKSFINYSDLEKMIKSLTTKDKD